MGRRGAGRKPRRGSGAGEGGAPPLAKPGFRQSPQGNADPGTPDLASVGQRQIRRAGQPCVAVWWQGQGRTIKAGI